MLSVLSCKKWETGYITIITIIIIILPMSAPVYIELAFNQNVSLSSCLLLGFFGKKSLKPTHLLTLSNISKKTSFSLGLHDGDVFLSRPSVDGRYILLPRLCNLLRSSFCRRVASTTRATSNTAAAAASDLARCH